MMTFRRRKEIVLWNFRAFCMRHAVSTMWGPNLLKIYCSAHYGVPYPCWISPKATSRITTFIESEAACSNACKRMTDKLTIDEANRKLWSR